MMLLPIFCFDRDDQGKRFCNLPPEHVGPCRYVDPKCFKVNPPLSADAVQLCEEWLHAVDQLAYSYDAIRAFDAGQKIFAKAVDNAPFKFVAAEYFKVFTMICGLERRWLWGPQPYNKPFTPPLASALHFMVAHGVGVGEAGDEDTAYKTAG